LSRDLKATLAQAASGFANSGGGVILWGVSTSKHQQSSLDILTETVPIANARRFAQQIDSSLPQLTTPSLTTTPSRLLHKKDEARGLVATYIPPTSGDPVASVTDRRFYLRTGDQFVEMPYEVLQRMFRGAHVPSLRPSFDNRLAQKDESGVWNFPIAVANESTAAAKDVCITVQVLNPEVCASMSSSGGFQDISPMNPGERSFASWLERPIHKGLHLVAGTLQICMKVEKRPKRTLNMQVRIFADGMPSREWGVKIHLTKTGFLLREVREQPGDN
jgi:hypothetical protein